ncbi:MAG: glycosyltransferase family 4 protein [Actinomycetota bacterium]
MRLAEVAPPWLAVPPTGYGGIESVVSLLSDGLVERGHEVTLFATGDSRTRAKLEWFFAEAPGIAALESIWHDCIQTLYAFRQADRFDLIHTHSRFSAVVAGAVTEVPVVHTIHLDLSPEMRALYSLVGDRSSFVAISESQRSHMPDLNYGGVVYNGIDVEAYPFRTEKDDFVLFLGRAGPQKGAHLAVRAARESGIRIVLAMKIAEQGEEEHWKHVVVPELPENATVLEEITFPEKADLLSRAKAVLFPIDWDEPFGLVMPEAMACGTPVIATARGSVPEVVADGKTGFIVSVENYPEEAAAAIRRLGEIDPAACRARVEERFSSEAMVEGYEDVFERVLASAVVPGS